MNKNHNVYEFSGNLESAIKNGEFRYIITFPGITNPVTKLLNTFDDKKEFIEDSFKRTLIKTRSPFRIGTIQINILEVDNVYSKEGINTNELTKLIQTLCKNYKNNIIAFPIMNNLVPFRNKILEILNDNVRDTKVVILN